MVVYCPKHRIGFNTDLDPSCPQCMLAGGEAPEPVSKEELDRPRATANAPRRREA